MMDVPLTITGLMRHAVTAYRGHEVVTWTGQGSRRQSFAETGVRVARLANALRELGVTADQRVATLMWNNAEHLEAYLAVPSMGAVLHTLNLRLAPAEIGYIATHAGDEIVIADATLVPLLAQVLPNVPGIRHVIVAGAGADLAGIEAGDRQVHSYDELLAAQPDSFDWPEPDERSAAAMCYTSGTTGMPKGVVYSHRSAYLHSMAACMGNAFGLAEGDRVLQAEPLIRLIEAERPTIAGAVPTIWNSLLLHVREHGGDLSSLRMVPCGGSAVPHALQEAYEKELGVRIVHAWGMTETSPLGSIAHPPSGVTGEEAWHYRDTQGKLFCAVEARLVGDSGQVLPSDGVAVGEIEVRGPWVTGSYYKDDDPAKFHDGWLRTGDVGTIDELGYITLTDRAKDVIKSGGEWISSMELENILMAHPAVAEAAVIGVADERWGERPFAAVVLTRPGAASAADLRSFLGEQVPRWKLPERWSFISEVPKTSVGKFAKSKIRDAYARGEYEVIEAR